MARANPPPLKTTGPKPNYVSVVAALLAASASCLLACAHATGPVHRSIQHDGLERNYLIYAPVLKPAHPGRRPLLLVLHGGGGIHRGMIRLTKGRFNQLAGWETVFAGGSGRPNHPRHQRL
jgi:poly(3-hydroxybutyrate) depolymerase